MRTRLWPSCGACFESQSLPTSVESGRTLKQYFGVEGYTNDSVPSPRHQVTSRFEAYGE
jgi:hypothetical protein